MERVMVLSGLRGAPAASGAQGETLPELRRQAADIAQAVTVHVAEAKEAATQQAKAVAAVAKTGAFEAAQAAIAWAKENARASVLAINARAQQALILLHIKALETGQPQAAAELARGFNRLVDHNATVPGLFARVTAPRPPATLSGYAGVGRWTHGGSLGRLGDTRDRNAGQTAPATTGALIDGLDGHPVTLAPGAAVTGMLTGNDLAQWQQAQYTALAQGGGSGAFSSSTAQTMAANIQQGAAGYRNVNVAGVEYQVRYNGNTHQLRLEPQLSVGADVAKAATVTAEGIGAIAKAALDAAGVACGLVNSSTIRTAADKAAGTQQAGATISRLCDKSPTGSPGIMAEDTGTPWGWILGGGALLAVLKIAHVF